MERNGILYGEKWQEAYCRQYLGSTYTDDFREPYGGKGCDGESGSEFEKQGEQVAIFLHVIQRKVETENQNMNFNLQMFKFEASGKYGFCGERKMKKLIHDVCL